MFDYNQLSPNRREFIDIARDYFPDIGTEISSNQVREIVNSRGIGWPQWFTTPENRSSRGMYHLPETHQVHTEPKPMETDDDIKLRIRNIYASMDDMVKAVSANVINSLVISGGAGLGKSYGVNKSLQEVYEGEYGYVFHRGHIKATHLFRLLWENRHKGMVIVLDDVDLWEDVQTLNLLKAALELKDVRRIGWGSEKEFEDQDGETIPRYFDYEGSIIFLTNEKIHDLIDAKNKNSPHLAAIESRSLVMDMNINTKREYRIALGLKVYEEGMLKNQGFSEHEITEIMEFFDENFESFREVSLRMIEKIARIYRAVPTWRTSIPSFCFKKKA